jgi:hypothetical protein
MAALPFTRLTHLYANAEGPDAGVPADEPQPPPTPLGRVADWQVQVRTEPKRDAKLVRTAKRDEILSLREQAAGDAVMAHNIVWYRLDDGWVYSSWVQPVLDNRNAPEPERAKAKFWGEVTVPYVDAKRAPDPAAGRMARLYYTSVYRVVDAVQGADNEWWYQLQDGVVYGSGGPFIPASHMRRLDPMELTPIKPELDPSHKSIVVDVNRQMLTAFEDEQPVLTSRTATGYGVFQTPKGTHKIIRKRMSSRMIGGVGNDAYDLPGVPFPSYFTISACAFHGAYWHNDFGRRRSHGCVNTPADAARWIWRWSLPEMAYEEVEIRTREQSATTVIVI